MLLAGLLAAVTCDDAPRGLDLAEELSRAFCAHQLNCCSPFELAAVTGGRYATEADCVAYATVSMRQQLGTIDGAIDLGRISVDPARAEACVKAFGERACNFSTSFPESVGPLPNVAEMLAFCPDLLVGHVPMNKACNVTQECAQGSRCVGSVPGNNGGFAGMVGSPTMPTSGLGLCVPYQKDGEHCNTSVDCDQAARFACQQPQFVCGPAGQVGDPCVIEYDFMTGTISSNCDASRRLYCDQFCRRYPIAGEPCDLNRPRGVRPGSGAGAVVRHHVRGGLQTSRQRRGRVRRPRHPALPRRSRVPPPAERRHRGVRQPSPARGGVHRPVRQPGGLRRGLLHDPRDTAAGREVHLQQRLRLAFLHRLQREFVLFAADDSPRCVGGGVTHGVVSGVGGQGGFAGSFPTGFAGSSFPGGRGPAGSGGGAGGMGGTSGTLGCPISNIAPQDPVIADLRRAKRFDRATDRRHVHLRGALGRGRSQRDHSERCLAHHGSDHGPG